MRRVLVALALLMPTLAPAEPLRLAAGTEVPLVTRDMLTSKTAAKGDPIVLVTARDVLVDGKVAIAKGSEAVGEVSEARGTGGLGTNGKLAIAPLYIRVGDTVVRLAGGASGDGRTRVDTVLGLALTAAISGRSATIPAGTPVNAFTLRPVQLPSR